MGIMVWTHVQPHRLRQDGSLIGVLSTEESQSDEELLEMAHRWKIVGVDLISSVSCDAPYEWSEKRDSEWECSNDRNNAESFHVAYDFGVKHNILRRLASYGCRITVVPSKWPALEILKMKPDGVLLSNGPGDCAAVPYAVETVKEIIGKVPVFGICMGHQLLGQALGGRSFKMKFRHHGGNHPVHKLLLKHYDNILRGTRKPAKEKKTVTSLPLPLDPILLASTEGLSEKKVKKQSKKRLWLLYAFKLTSNKFSFLIFTFSIR